MRIGVDLSIRWIAKKNIQGYMLSGFKPKNDFRNGRENLPRKTLFENLDWRKYLSKQLRVGRDDRKYKVVYNKSGKEVQAARIANHDIAGQTLYYLVTKSDEEALFVCGVLNAPCMQTVCLEIGGLQRTTFTSRFFDILQCLFLTLTMRCTLK